MAMNNEAVDPLQMAPPDGKPPQPAEVLRPLLDTPKPKDEAWQVSAGRAVSMLAIALLNEADDHAALRSVALFGLAQSLGVKEARKRSIKLSRWAEDAPPPLTTLAMKDEQQAALNALTKLTASWTRRYAAKALADTSLAEDLVADLLRWARATYSDNLVFAQDFYAPQVAGAATAERTATMLKEGAKLLKPSKPESAARLADATATLVDAFLKRAELGAADDKAHANGVTALIHLVQDLAASAPAVLMQPTFVMAVGRLCSVMSKGATSKQAATVTDALSLATVSLLMADQERMGSQTADHWKAMVPTWRSAYPGWDASISSAMAVSPAMAAFIEERSEAPHESSDPYATEAVFARLLPAWDVFVAELPDASRAASLSAMLHQAAGTVGVAPLGEKGAVVRYDPLSHHLAQEADAVPTLVRIVRPGIRVRRHDGSERVVVAALVTAV